MPDEIMRSVGCAAQKAAKLPGGLDGKTGRIERNRQGPGRPNVFYAGSSAAGPKSKIRNNENQIP